ncbi:hypothetical protein DRO48_03680 [Candidatus Bathyarchaeota archaeon]|nr:MAG: hypothetical protein DRO48_03680 [Candidatus Bathyarchaeota archaeon]
MVDYRVIMEEGKLAKQMKEDEENVKWLIQHYEQLKREYPNKYVAIRKKKVVDADTDITKLMQRLERRFGGTENVLIHFINTKNVRILF